MKKLLILTILLNFNSWADQIVIGAKKFTEGNISAYIIAQSLKKIDPSLDVKVLESLGGTGIVTTALVNNEIDLYVDYTGTLVQTFKTSYDNLDSTLNSRGLQLASLLGFNNSYGLAVKKESKVTKISELSSINYSKARMGISHEYFKRTDGYSALSAHYNLSQKPTTIEHALLYTSLNSNSLDVIEVYTTDAKIKKYDLRVLNDDKSFFDKYDAVLVANSNFAKNNKNTLDKLNELLTNSISSDAITRANYLVEIKGLSYEDAAREITNYKGEVSSNSSESILPYFVEHIEYLFVTVLICIIIGVPLGVLTAKSILAERVLLSLISIFQTIPSLALLVFLIPLFGLGKLTTIVALVIYGLLPIVKNTHSGIKSISTELLEYSDLIGMKPLQKIIKVEIPLSIEMIISGIKLTAIYTIGITVIAAFVGAGGLGTLIVTGLSLDDTVLILKGAIPSAILAIVVEIIFQKIIPLFINRRV
jgi:osmoprotectant transport system permease protein